MKTTRNRSLVLMICWLSAICQDLSGQIVVPGNQYYNGFDVSNASVSLAQILRGGPPRDGIPAILNPKFTAPSAATLMQPGDLVIAVSRNGISHAYPLRIMLWHEVVNDQFNGEPLVITYCPLCGTSMVFEALLEGQRLTFGVSGLLYQSDVLIYDHQSESLWSQLSLKAISGPRLDQTLNWVPSQILTWEAWKRKYPNGEVLSTDTGFQRDYTVNPYAGYEKSPVVWFGVPVRRTEFLPKTFVLGVLVDGIAKAYVIDQLPTDHPFIDRIEAAKLEVTYNAQDQAATIRNASTGAEIPFTTSFWFAWQAFYPNTEIWNYSKLTLDRHLKLLVRAETGKSYALERSSDLKEWTPAGTLKAENGQAEASSGFTASRQFYRLRLLNDP